MNPIRRQAAPPGQICWKFRGMAAPISANRFSVQPRIDGSAVALAEPASNSEACPQVELQAARRQLAGGLAERTVGHARVDSVEIGAVKQIEDFALGLDLHLFREEPRDIE